MTQNLFQPSSLTGSVGAQAGALIAGRSIGFVRGVLLAWLLSQREFGAFQVAVAVVNLLVPLSSLGLTFGVLRYAPTHEVRGTLYAFSRRAGAMVLVIGAATAVLLISAPATVVDLVFATGSGVGTATATTANARVPASLVCMAAVCVFSLIVFHFVVDLMKGLRLFRAASLMETLGVVLFSSLALLAPAVGYASADSVVLAYGVGNVATVVLFLPPLLRYVRAQPADVRAESELPRIDSALLRYSVWIAASQVAWHGLQQYVLWHLAIVGGYALAATYFAVRLFAQLILLGGQTLSRAFSANVTRVWEATGPEDALVRLEAGSKIGCLAILSGAVLLSLVKPWILMAFPSGYSAGADCFEPLLLAYAWFAALEFLLIRFHLEKKSVYTFWASLAGALANIGLAIVVMGLPGAAATSDAGSMLVRASWVCAAGSGVSILTCLTVLTMSRKRPSASVLLLIIAFVSLGAGTIAATATLALMAACCMSPAGLFGLAERTIIANWFRGR